MASRGNLTKKIIYIFLVITCCLITSTVFSAELTWNTFLGGTGQHLGYGIAIDNDGYVYTVGLDNTNWNTTLFGSPFEGIAMQGGVTDGTIAKLDPDGNVLWYRFFGGSVNDALSAVTLDADGNIYIVGYAFYGYTFTPQATPVPVHSYVGGDIDMFVAKLDTDGNLIWDTYLGSTSNDYINAITVDTEGNVYIGGESYRVWHADFNNVIGTNKSSDGYQGVIAKLDSAGNYVWHRFLSTYEVYDLDTDDSGFLYTVKKGLFYSGSWNYPAEVGKYNTTTGAEIWKITLGSGTQDGFGIKLDDSGNIFVRGVSDRTWETPLHAYSGSRDAYVAKLNNDGVLQWNTFFGSAGNDTCRDGQSCGLDLDGSGNIYITGASASTWGDPLRAHAGGAYDGYVAMLNPSGSLVWNMFLGGSNQDLSLEMAVSSGGDIFFTGYTQQISWGTPVDFPNCYYCHFVGKITNSVTLNVEVDGEGDGTITSVPGTIDCGIDCTEGFSTGAEVVLTATPDEGSAIGEWSGGGCSGSSDTCTVTMNENTTVTVTFVPSTYTVTVAKTGAGSGTVSTMGEAINCGDNCVGTHVPGSIVLLIPTPAANSNFSGWSGACEGLGNCELTVNTNKLVTARFTLKVDDNHAPVIEDEEDVVLECEPGSLCGLPDWATDDDDGDDLEISWQQVEGDDLHFTEDGGIDLESHPVRRGTYYVQYIARDEYADVASEVVTITVPNNPPRINLENINVSGAAYRNTRYELPQFTKDVDVDALFTDTDNDNLSYSWSLDISNSDLAGFVSTAAGESQLRVRMAGDITITVTVDDGYGGTTTEEFVVSIPLPEVNSDDMDIQITDWTRNTSNRLFLTGTLSSPVWPIVLVNGVAATVTLANTGSTPALIKGVAIASVSDTYSFTANNIPADTDISDVEIEVLTSVNDENVSLASKTASLTTELGGDDTGDGDGDGLTGGNDMLQMAASWGCSLQMLATHSNWSWILAFIPGFMLAIRLKKRS